VKGFAGIAKPLHQLTAVGERVAAGERELITWQPEHELAFEKLKRMFVSTPVLAYPMMLGGQFVVDTDASGFAIGAVLSQKQENGEERVISYASRSLTDEERNYCTTRRELLAVV
jgi:hypothetical protein